MQLKRRVALNGVWLDEVDSRIVISSIEPADGKENITATNAAAGFGQRVTGNRRNTLDMVIKFRMLEHGHTVTGLQERSQLLEAVNAWAHKGGYLTLNYRPDRRLNVILAQAPGEGSLWDYSKEFQITFRAYGVPYWEQETAKKITFGGSTSSGSGVANIEGSAKTQCNAELLNNSGMLINTATVTVAGKTMSFTELALAAGETLVIDHSDGLVRIRIRNTANKYRSAMANRSVSSADDLVAAPGNNSCSFTAQRACKMTVSWRSRYL